MANKRQGVQSGLAALLADESERAAREAKYPEVQYPQGFNPGQGQAKEAAAFSRKLQQLYQDHPEYYVNHLRDIAELSRQGFDAIRSKYLLPFEGPSPAKPMFDDTIYQHDVWPDNTSDNSGYIGGAPVKVPSLPNGPLMQLLKGIK